MKKEKNYTPFIISPDYGKVPPQALDAERAVLGTCLAYLDSISEVRLRPEMFYKEAHQKIFESILELANKGQCDMVLLTDDLRKKNLLDSIGGPVYLLDLTNRVYTNQLLNEHSLMVKQAFNTL